MLSGNSTGFGNKPRALMCYICGREYGTTSLQIHLKTCMKKWEIEEGKKPKKERRPMPQPPKQLLDVLNKINAGNNVNLAELESYNNKANDEYNDSALIRCEYCNRTFLPERLGIHRKICTPEKPFKPLPPPNTGAKSSVSSTSTSASTSKSIGGGVGGYGGGRGAGNANYGYREEEEQIKSTAVNRGAGLAKKPPSRGQYQGYDDDEDNEYDNSYAPPKSTQTKVQPQTRAQPMAKPSRNQGYGGGYGDMGGEYQNVQLEECNMCGRRFAADRIDRHQKACTRAQKGEAKHAKKVAMAEKKQAEVDKFIAKEAKYKKSNWRQQHEEFVNNLKYNRKLKAVEDRGGDIRALGPPPKSSAIEMNMVECPYCARKFNPQSAEKHINICKNVINKPKAVPGKGAPLRTSTQTSGFGTSTSKAIPSKAPANKFGGTASYGKSSYGNYGGYDDDDYQQPSYNPNNYGSGMGQSRQSYGTVKQPAQKGGGFSTQYGGQQSRGSTNQYGGSTQGMNASGRASGLGVKPTSSLANTGKMSMQQQDYNNYNQPSSKAPKSGYRY